MGLSAMSREGDDYNIVRVACSESVEILLDGVHGGLCIGEQDPLSTKRIREECVQNCGISISARKPVDFR